MALPFEPGFRGLGPRMALRELLPSPRYTLAVWRRDALVFSKLWRGALLPTWRALWVAHAALAAIPPAPGADRRWLGDLSLFTRHVDYLAYEWKLEDIWSSWRYIVARRKVYSNSVRLENASWRTWAKAKDNLRTVSPESINGSGPGGLGFNGPHVVDCSTDRLARVVVITLPFARGQRVQSGSSFSPPG